MTAQMDPRWLDAGMPGDSLVLVKRMLVVSLVLHLAGLALVAGIRFTPKAERLQATQVTLVSLPQPQPEAAPQPAVEPSPPPTPQPAAPPARRASAPIAAKIPVMPSVKENVTMKAADNRLRDALRGIERPPEAPRLGEYRPAPVPVPPVTETKAREKQPSLSELAKQLEQVQRPQPKAAVASKPKPVAKPVTAIQVSGDESGLGRYLALVQSKISEQWVAPPVDAGNRSYQVVIKFRLYRSGRISDVTVERESGNGYYDDAGKRAVLSVGQLPSFPLYVTEDMLETHFSFTVGEEAG
ncbi:MAG TPA: energy transducer TonB [Nitrospiraceae bacterium]|nr:energy transducer TonB [Nitrospiraceae bacterium]